MSADADRKAGALGCYGLAFTGLPDAADRLTPTGPDATPVVVRRTIVPGVTEAAFELDRSHAVLPLSDGASVARVARDPFVVDATLREDYADEAMVHPLLSGSCAVLNWWLGRDAMHAGAFEMGGRAWAVIGDKGQGKSTTLGYLARHDVPIISDDLVVEDSGDVFAGPSFVDLRPDAARHLGIGRDLGQLGARPRFRHDVPRTRWRTPLAGWLVLGWGEHTRLTPVPVPQRLELLYRNRAVLLEPADPSAFVRHLALPFLRLERPKNPSSLPAVLDLLTTSLPD